VVTSDVVLRGLTAKLRINAERQSESFEFPSIGASSAHLDRLEILLWKLVLRKFLTIRKKDFDACVVCVCEN
jgi:hypothetical protein